MLRATKRLALIRRYCGASKGKHIKRWSLEAQGDENKMRHETVSVKLEVFNSDCPLIFSCVSGNGNKLYNGYSKSNQKFWHFFHNIIFKKDKKMKRLARRLVRLLPTNPKHEICKWNEPLWWIKCEFQLFVWRFSLEWKTLLANRKDSFKVS